jgi:hypothetical protein
MDSHDSSTVRYVCTVQENTRTVGHLDARNYDRTYTVRSCILLYRIRAIQPYMVDMVKLSIRSKIASFIRTVLFSDRSGVLGTAWHRIREQCGFRDDHLDAAGFGSIGTVVGITD